MLKISFIKKNKEKIITGLNKKFFKNIDLIEEILLLNHKKNSLKIKIDKFLIKLKILSKNIGSLLKEKKKNNDLNSLRKDSYSLKIQIKDLNKLLLDINKNLLMKIIKIPNIPDEKVKKYNNEIIYLHENDIFNNIKNINNKIISHIELGKKYKLFNFEIGVKTSGSGFPIYIDKGAKIQRGLIQYFIEQNIAAGYIEYNVPYLVNNNAAYYTGQIPDKDNQMYFLEKDTLYLIPTGEIPLLNIYQNTILSYKDLPIKNTTYTACFRREAGSYGKKYRGLNRLHQFDKVEIIQITTPENSYQALYNMVNHIKYLLISLKLPFRIIRLCGKNLGFTSAMTYDFEIYNILQNKWLEVSSVSNCLDFQANRLKLRYRELNQKIKYCHTLNGSSLAIPRLFLTLLENNQKNNKIYIPNVLIPHIGFEYINL